MKNIKSTGLLIVTLLLAAAVLLSWSLILFKNTAAEREESGDTTPQADIWQTIKCRSAADGAEVEALVAYPPLYGTMELRPMLFAFPDAPQLQNVTQVQGIVARIKVRRGNAANCGWLLQRDAQGILDSLVANLPVDRERIFVLANNIEELEFVCNNAPRFNGVIISLPDGCGDEWQQLPLRNLVQLPVYVDTSVNLRPPVQARRLAARLRSLGANVEAPEELVASGNPAIARATAALMEARQDTTSITWQHTGHTAEHAWWLKPVKRENPRKDAIITAVSSRDGMRNHLNVTLENLTAFSIKRSGEVEKPLFMRINGQQVILPNLPAGVSQWQHLQLENGIWDAASGELPAEEDQRWTVAGVLQSPFVIITGTSDENRAAAWRKSGTDFAEAWQKATGTAPMLMTDREYLANPPAGKNPVFFGSPEENLACQTMLKRVQPHLRALYTMAKNTFPDTMSVCSATVHRLGMAAANRALMLIANDSKGIAEAWKPFCTPENLQHRALVFTTEAPGKTFHADDFGDGWLPAE